MQAFLFFFVFVCVCQKGSWSHVFLAETVETGYIYTFCIVMWSTIFSKDVELFWNWLVPRILSLESIVYFGTSEYSVLQWSKKRRIFAELLQNLDGEADWSGVVNVCCNSMQMSLVMSMLFLSTSYWNDAPCSSFLFLHFGNNVILSNRGPWFWCIYTCALNQFRNKSSNMLYMYIVKEYLSVDKVGHEKLLAAKSCFL